MDDKELNFLDKALKTIRQAFWYVVLFSFASNLLMLALPLYTLQVLDRVVTSQSLETLFWLTVVIGLTLIFMGAFQVARSLALIKVSEWLGKKVQYDVLSTSLSIAATRPGISGSQNLRDVNTLKSFLTGGGMIALMDAPFSIIFVIVIFMIHAIPGVVVLVGALALFFFAVLNEIAMRKPLNEANDKSVKFMNSLETLSRNAEAMEAMGMMPSILRRWGKENDEIVYNQSLASNRSSIINAAAKVVRMLLQIAIMGTGAIFVLQNELTVGGMIACSILAGRALAPFEMAISAWTGVSGAKEAYHRLKKVIEGKPERSMTVELPVPKGHVSAEKVIFAPEGVMRPVIKGITFQLPAGQSLGIVGPSAAGKSTLAKLVVGVWKPNSGVIRLDSADVYSWDREDFGKHIGYLPQDVELLTGTVRENIARMREDATDQQVVQAATLAGAHEMILHLPNGYQTEVGVGGANLSAGQQQRIGLARAFFDQPKLLVLDEPNSNLDEAGERSLILALKRAKALNITTIIVTHRMSVLSAIDSLMMIRDGAVEDSGPTQEVIDRMAKKRQQLTAQQQAQAAAQQNAAPPPAQQAAPAEEQENKPKRNSNKGKKK